VGAIAAGTRLHITIVLRPRDPAGLAAYARAVSTPGSSVYHDYLTPVQFAQRFGATVAQVDAVRSSMAAHGLQPGPASANRLSIPLTGTAARVERAFSLSFRRTALTNGRRAVIASAPPAIDSSIAGDVQAVLGLSTLAAPHPLISRPGLVRDEARSHIGSRVAPHVVTGGPQPCQAASSAASSQGAYTADQIASAYGYSGLYGAGAEGQGQTIAIYELESNDPNDIAAYQACYGTDASVSYVPVDGGAGSGPGSGEAALDIENAVGLAPRANFLVYQGPNSNQDSPGSGPYDTFSTIISQDRARVISVSWGQCEQVQGARNAQGESTLFEEAAAQGQSIISATGDEGSEDCNQSTGLPNPALAVDDPGSQPFVTGVGGTTLSSLGPPPSEHVWNSAGNPVGLVGVQGGAGGGGVSQLWTMPTYQSGAPASLRLINANSSRSRCGNVGGYCREVPDIAADADPNTGYIIYANGAGGDPATPSGWQAVGGTSAAAPVWAALIADVNSSSACQGSVVGFANPALYAAAGRAYGSYFNDVTTGNNDLAGTNGGLYPAGPAYDMASGLGSPNATPLAAALCANSLAVNNPGTQLSTAGQRVSLQITTTLPSRGKLGFSASQLPPGLSISRASGLITGRPSRLGVWSVAVTASEPGATLRGASFSWRVVGAPTVSQATLSGVGAAQPRLAFTVTAGRKASALKSVTIGLPGGLSFSGAGRNLIVTGRGGRHVRFSSRLVRGRLQVTLTQAARQLSVAVSYATLKVAPRLAAGVRQHRSHALEVTIQTTDASNHGVTVRARIEPRG
jgi:subtilase family serine protease